MFRSSTFGLCINISLRPKEAHTQKQKFEATKQKKNIASETADFLLIFTQNLMKHNRKYRSLSLSLTIAKNFENVRDNFIKIKSSANDAILCRPFLSLQMILV